MTALRKWWTANAPSIESQTAYERFMQRMEIDHEDGVWTPDPADVAFLVEQARGRYRPALAALLALVLLRGHATTAAGAREALDGLRDVGDPDLRQFVVRAAA